MFCDIYPTGKTTDICLGGWNFSYYNTYHFKPNLMLQVNKIESLMLVLDFMVNATLKNTQTYFCGIHGMP